MDQVVAQALALVGGILRGETRLTAQTA